MTPKLQALLPQRAVSRLVGRLGLVERPRWLVRPVVGAFARRYGVDLAEAALPLSAYRSFTDFFTRRLRVGSRPLPDADDRLAWPADGTVAAGGTVEDGHLLQAKGHRYRLADLLGDADLARSFDGGTYRTVYLSPRDYHRVHAPWHGRLSRRIHRPGRLFAVNARTVAAVPGVFTGNERVVLAFDDPQIGRWVLVLVGALIVGGIETVWEGTVNPLPTDADADRRFDPGPTVERGEEVGLFRAGSTVIALFARERVMLGAAVEGNTVRMGEAMGRCPGG